MGSLFKKKSLAWSSVACNTFLACAKLVVGFLTGSASTISEAAHSAMDLIGEYQNAFAGIHELEIASNVQCNLKTKPLSEYHY